MQGKSAKETLNYVTRKLLNNGFAMTAVGVMALGLPVA